jgi:hypothetical protein
VLEPAVRSPYDHSVRRLRLASLSILLVVLAGTVLLSACSSDDDSSRPAPTSSTTSTSATTTTSSTTTTPSTTTVPPPPPTTAPAPGPRIVSFTGPPLPVECNAPTSIELHWQTIGATTVTMRIDGGPVFATYADGTNDKLLPLACDGKPHTYTLTARDAAGRTATGKVVITEPRP